MAELATDILHTTVKWQLKLSETEKRCFLMMEVHTFYRNIEKRGHVVLMTVNDDQMVQYHLQTKWKPQSTFCVGPKFSSDFRTSTAYFSSSEA